MGKTYFALSDSHPGRKQRTQFKYQTHRRLFRVNLAEAKDTVLTFCLTFCSVIYACMFIWHIWCLSGLSSKICSDIYWDMIWDVFWHLIRHVHLTSFLILLRHLFYMFDAIFLDICSNICFCSLGSMGKASFFSLSIVLAAMLKMAELCIKIRTQADANKTQTNYTKTEKKRPRGKRKTGCKCTAKL